mgnify:CR=1 FL=1
MLDAEGLSEGEALTAEFRHGQVALQQETLGGAARFVAGEGRHGSFG